ncbi:hypothetical protein NDU88_001883 [Pleurodeles waltl]|uniref:Uncharacterized protein n=1 Tax=Pleurodeles waltl TaxID=8319 RepID=A0AAV7TLM3_PLEWA|nr:hypothetical protein NDU88_001883 [Pleurodeles waltl]
MAGLTAAYREPPPFKGNQRERGRATKHDGRLEQVLRAAAILGGPRGREDSRTTHRVQSPPLPQQRRCGFMPWDPAGAGRRAGNLRLALGRSGLARGVESRLQEAGDGVPAAAKRQSSGPRGLREL